MKHARRLFPVLVALSLAGPAAAQGAPAARVTKLTFDLGYVNVSGNTSVTTFNVGERLVHTAGRWTYTQTATALFGQTDGSTTAEAYEAGVRGDYKLGKRLSAFGLGTWFRNAFAGVARRFSEGVGLSLRAIQAPHDSLNVEGSLSFNQERSVAGVSNSFAASRAALVYKHAFGTAAVFTQNLELISNLENSDDQRVNSETALAAPISKQVAFKAAYVIRYDHQPEPGFQDTDRIITTGIQIAF